MPGTLSSIRWPIIEDPEVAAQFRLVLEHWVRLGMWPIVRKYPRDSYGLGPRSCLSPKRSIFSMSLSQATQCKLRWLPLIGSNLYGPLGRVFQDGWPHWSVKLIPRRNPTQGPACATYFKQRR